MNVMLQQDLTLYKAFIIDAPNILPPLLDNNTRSSTSSVPCDGSTKLHGQDDGTSGFIEIKCKHIERKECLINVTDKDFVDVECNKYHKNDDTQVKLSKSIKRLLRVASSDSNSNNQYSSDSLSSDVSSLTFSENNDTSSPLMHAKNYDYESKVRCNKKNSLSNSYSLFQDHNGIIRCASQDSTVQCGNIKRCKMRSNTGLGSSEKTMDTTTNVVDEDHDDCDTTRKSNNMYSDFENHEEEGDTLSTISISKDLESFFRSKVFTTGSSSRQRSCPIVISRHNMEGRRKRIMIGDFENRSSGGVSSNSSLTVSSEEGQLNGRQEI
jgi:hypothetical protein